MELPLLEGAYLWGAICFAWSIVRSVRAWRIRTPPLGLWLDACLLATAGWVPLAYLAEQYVRIPAIGLSCGLLMVSHLALTGALALLAHRPQELRPEWPKSPDRRGLFGGLSAGYKAALVAVPLAAGMFLLLLILGRILFGATWQMSGAQVAATFTGFVAHRIALTHFAKAEKTN